MTEMFPATGERSPPQLGFGCVGLTALPSRKDALRILETAFDSGIRHFDVARAYGMGVAEVILGEFLRDRRDPVTVATKFGIDPPPYGQRLPFLSTLKGLLKRVPALDRRIRRRVSADNTMGNFSPETARCSLEASLKALGTDYIDLWLLHEGTAADAARPELLEFLAREMERGTVKAVGIGSEPSRIGDECAVLPPTCTVLQLENNVLAPNLRHLRNTSGRRFITHSAFKNAAACRERPAGQTAAVDRYRERTGIDLAKPANLHALLLAWAVQDNPDGMVLFGSGSQRNIRANVAALSDAPSPPPPWPISRPWSHAPRWQSAPGSTRAPDAARQTSSSGATVRELKTSLQVVAQADGEGRHGQHRVGMAGCGEHRAACHLEVIHVEHPAVRVHHTRPGVRRHSGSAGAMQDVPHLAPPPASPSHEAGVTWPSPNRPNSFRQVSTSPARVSRSASARRQSTRRRGTPRGSVASATVTRLSGSGTCSVMPLR